MSYSLAGSLAELSQQDPLRLVSAGYGDLRDLDHEKHGVSGLVAKRTANRVHGVLVCHSLQALAIHRQQFIPRLQIQTQDKV